MAAAGRPVTELYPLGGAVSLESCRQAVSEICKEHSATPARESNHSSLVVGGEPGEQKQSPSESCVPSRASSHPHSLAETPSPHHEIVMNAINETLRLAEQCRCNIITTICRGASSVEGGVQQPQTRCVCVSSPIAAAKVDGVEKKVNLPPNCDKALCYGSYFHHANFEDTFAAYCHPQPIPAHSQLLPRQIEPSCNIQRAAAPPSPMNHLTLPRLISSVSETGLDAKHLLRCCNLNCSWISSLPPGECCSSPVGHVRTMTRNMGTMTAHKVLRDVGVQTEQTVTPHVFPQVCLAAESRSKKLSGAPKSPVKEVKWDAEGMTWEVYGASVDPEELGLAIQRHLELQIKETAIHAAKLSRQNTSTSRQSRNTGSQRKKSRMMGSIRTPACCARTTTAVD
uniref:G protein-regulated inducer of neurite outgrowth C-terminal domain-containing protein n=1 Tax=Dicentrarchus labrax TaxID=13489 RepID=A0A8P4K596_DICLA